jgi:hypothetical protein
MPLPLSRISRNTPGPPFRPASPVVIAIAPEMPPMASAAFKARFISTCCIWLGSDSTAGRPEGSWRANAIFFEIELCISLDELRTTADRASGSTIKRPLPA